MVHYSKQTACNGDSRDKKLTDEMKTGSKTGQKAYAAGWYVDKDWWIVRKLRKGEDGRGYFEEVNGDPNRRDGEGFVRKRKVTLRSARQALKFDRWIKTEDKEKLRILRSLVKKPIDANEQKRRSRFFGGEQPMKDFAKKHGMALPF